MALVAISTLAVLMTAIGIYVVAENKNTLSQERNTQAYYIARAGVVATTEWITGMTTAEQTAFEALSFPITSEPEAFGEGEFIVTIEKNGTTLTLTSVGRVLSAVTSSGNEYVENSVSTVLTRSASGAITTFDKAAFAMSKLSFGGNVIEGGAGVGSFDDDAFDITNWGTLDAIYLPVGADASEVIKTPSQWYNLDTSKIHYEEIPSYPEPVFPDFPSGLLTRSDVSLSGNKTATINTSGYYNNITINNDCKLTIDTSNGNIDLVVNTLNIQQGHIIITGNNKVNLYVNNITRIKGSINNGGQGNTPNSSADKSKLALYYNGDASKTVSFDGETVIQGSVYLNKASLDLTGGAKVLGDIITAGTSIKISGGFEAYPQVLYAPNAKVTISGGGAVYGAIVADEIEMTGGSRVVLENGSIDPTVPIEVGGGASSYTQQYWM